MVRGIRWEGSPEKRNKGKGDRAGNKLPCGHGVSCNLFAGHGHSSTRFSYLPRRWEESDSHSLLRSFIERHSWRGLSFSPQISPSFIVYSRTLRPTLSSLPFSPSSFSSLPLLPPFFFLYHASFLFSGFPLRFAGLRLSISARETSSL